MSYECHKCKAHFPFLFFYRESFRVCTGSCAHPRWLHGIDYYPDLCVLLAGTVRVQEALKMRWGVAGLFQDRQGEGIKNYDEGVERKL